MIWIYIPIMRGKNRKRGAVAPLKLLVERLLSKVDREEGWCSSQMPR
jgi:hypothetical protein